MNLTRRQLLMTGSGALMSSLAPRFGQAAAVVPALTAKPGKSQIAPDGYPKTDIWGYDGQVPGPQIRLKQGQRVSRTFVNELPQASTVHWHGIRIDSAMDGVPELSQPLVEPNASFEYDFKVPDAGTFWYHPHNRSWEQMARGLYGALIVEERNPPEVDGDITLLIDDWRMMQDAAIAGDFDALMDRSHGGRRGNWITVNGDGPYKRNVRQHQRLRLRLVNVANSQIFNLSLKGMRGWIAALDGQPVDHPITAGNMTLAPAQRIDLIVDVTAEANSSAYLFSSVRNEATGIVNFAVGAPIRPQILGEPAPLPPNPLPALGSLQTAKHISLLMEGGAMGRMDSAIFAGERLGIRDLVQTGNAWAFNGIVGRTDAPLSRIELGQTALITITNDTGWPHAMHLHGHHFRQIMDNGETGPLRDTLLMQRDEKTRIAFVADNPGKWLLHCHMLEHAAAGMTTWLEVG